uniref:Transmembrane protein 241-like isoform X1 n=1 Tax=Hirondellea gigas TaxID=1518452 RepID=A0A6A7FRP9_9CRUS
MSCDTISNFIFYIVLFGSTVFINKYVLSVLRFTYPTIYQGWQTLVGGLLLRLLLYKSSWLTVSPTPMDKAGFISLVPSFLFFVAGIVASSKALANLSIGMFLCLHNTLPSVLYLLDVFLNLRGSSSGGAVGEKSSSSGGDKSCSKCSVLAAVLVLLTAMAAVFMDLDITFSDSPYFWLVVSLLCVAVQRLHSRIADARYTEIDKLYFSYVFSVVVLAPASLYLEEAFNVLDFPHASRLDFMGACLLVGVLALVLSLHTIKVQEHQLFGKLDAVSKLLTSVASVFVFEDQLSSEVMALLLLNLCFGLLVPYVSKTSTADSTDDWPATAAEDSDTEQLIQEQTSS